jgi:hypothetical protein
MGGAGSDGHTRRPRAAVAGSALGLPGRLSRFGGVRAGDDSCLERRDRRGDRGAAVLLCVSLLCSSIGLAVVVLGLLLVVLQAPRKWRRLWVIGVPVVLYLIWYAFYGVSTIQTHNIVHIPKYVAQALFAAVSSVTGLAQTPAHVSPFLVSTAIGRYVALLVIVLAAWHLARGGGFPPLFWASSGAALALWVAECLEYTMPARSARQSRYQYTAAALLLLAAVAAVAGHWIRPAGGCRAGCGRGGDLRVQYLDAQPAFEVLDREQLLRGRGDRGSEDRARRGVAHLQPRERVHDSHDRQSQPADRGRLVPVGRRRLRVCGRSAERNRAPTREHPRGDRLHPRRSRTAGARQRARLDRHGPGCRTAPAGSALGGFTVGPGDLHIQVAPRTAAQLQLRRFGSNYRFVSYGNVPPAFHLPRLASGRPLTSREIAPAPPGMGGSSAAGTSWCA